tara:strand:- start:14313 stop:14822 length:510 start_codon:yes stop_codon:yes gene_type:complete
MNDIKTQSMIESEQIENKQKKIKIIRAFFLKDDASSNLKNFMDKRMKLNKKFKNIPNEYYNEFTYKAKLLLKDIFKKHIDIFVLKKINSSYNKKKLTYTFTKRLNLDTQLYEKFGKAIDKKVKEMQNFQVVFFTKRTKKKEIKFINFMIELLDRLHTLSLKYLNASYEY